ASDTPRDASAAFLPRALPHRLVQLELDLLPDLPRLDLFCAIDLNRRDNRTRLHHDNYLHSVPLGLAENTNVLKLPRLIEVANIILDYRVRIGAADFGPHLRQDLFRAHGLWAGVFNLDGTNDRAVLGIHGQSNK